MFRWQFRRMQPGEMNVDPIEAEFFATSALDSLTDALVREAIQNSLDARKPGEQVRVRIAFPPASPAVEEWFKALWPHLQASRSGIAAVPDQHARLPYLLVEDFGTRGLQGDPAQSEDEALDEATARNDFYYFWRNIGRSRKSSSDLGRWGLGKTVFPATSGINAFLALTVRADDGRALLMGQSVLRIHKLDGARYYPYGYGGAFSGDFAHPVEDPALLDRFRAAFQLTRGTQPGLSVLVPWPDPEVTPETVLPSVIRHYFVPVLAGDLVVEIASARGVERIDSITLPEMVASGRPALDPADRSDLERLVALTRFGQSLPRAEFVQLAAPPADSAPRWAADCLERAGPQVRERFEAGLPIAFNVPLWVKPAEAEPALSEFEVYLERDEQLPRGEEHFVREGIAVAGVRGGLAKGVRAVVIAQHPGLASLLGDAENPAHTEWQERSPKFKDRYRHGPFTLRYVRNAPREIARALTRPSIGRHERLLQHLFSLDMPTEENVINPRKDTTNKAGEGRSAPGKGVNGAASPPSIQIQKTKGGFRLIGIGDGPLSSHLVVRVAYEVRRGDPFARYQPPDFDLSSPPIAMDMDGLMLEQSEGNVLVLRIEQPGYRLSIEGFDPHRDIRVRVAPEEARR